MRTDIAPLRLAIIGGGVSGLSSAYYLLQQARANDRRLSITLYERKPTLGGNADTVVVDLGDYIDDKGVQHAYVRWADLGVNDVNLTTYVKLKKIMQEIGYLDSMKPLQDTTSYFNRDGSLALTDDAALRDGVTDPAFSLARADHGRLAALIKVVHRSAIDLLNTITPDYTVGHFFDDCVARPVSMLSQAAEQLKIEIDWDDVHLPSRMARVRDDIYYPRIAAMYFTDEHGPATLPLQSPFEYYRLQEGDGTAPPDRRYFEHGAQKWLEALATYLLAQSGEQISITLHTAAPMRVQVKRDGVALTQAGQAPQHFDLCVLATHADDTRHLLDFDTDMATWRQRIDAVLSTVSYTRGYAVCHTYAGKMPHNTNLWRTYNVLQREAGASSFPYRMSYVENLHQNDPFNPQYARAGLPLFLVSLVKSLSEIPTEDMLDRVRQTHRVSPAMLAALPRTTQRQLRGESLPTGYRTEQDVVHPALSGKAWTAFKHNVLDAKCIAAQNTIELYNQDTGAQIQRGHRPECALLFAGGWTRGAGLQEQCLEQSERVATWVLPATSGAFSPGTAFDRAVVAKAA